MSVSLPGGEAITMTSRPIETAGRAARPDRICVGCRHHVQQGTDLSALRRHSDDGGFAHFG